MDPGWLSKAYLVYDEPGGTAVFVDSGAPLGPLLAAVEQNDLAVTHLLTTHGHGDHIVGRRRARLAASASRSSRALSRRASCSSQALATPGHSDDGLTFVVNGEAAFTGDTLFKDAVGGGDFETVKSSVMDVLMALPHDTHVYPGHTDETTIGAEWESNPFVRVWRGIEPEGTEPCTVGGDAATLIVWSPDYDGKGKAWVRFDDGRDAIVGGSRVERSA